MLGRLLHSILHVVTYIQYRNTYMYVSWYHVYLAFYVTTTSGTATKLIIIYILIRVTLLTGLIFITI